MENDDLHELKETYSFNEKDLKRVFTCEGDETFQKYQALVKIHNLYIFRKMYEQKLEFPPNFITFNYKIIMTAEKKPIENLNQMLDKSHFNQEQDLTTLITKAIPDNNWILDYFIISSFPSIFGHFCSKEYCKYAYNFMTIYINDVLTPKLVGTFLLHSFVFRERLLIRFFHHLDSDSDYSESSLKYLFFEVLSANISYLNKYQIRIVNLLRQTNEDSAILAVFDYFLYHLIENWQYSPYFALTNTIYQFSPNKIDQHQKNYHKNYKNILLQSLQSSTKEFKLKIMDFFSDNIYEKMPKISEIIFFNGTRFAVTCIDICLANIIDPLSKNKTFDVKIDDGFVILTKLNHIINSRLEFPVQPNPSTCTDEMLFKYRKQVHKFLYERSGGLKVVKNMTKSIEEIIPLVVSSYGDKLYEIKTKILRESKEDTTNEIQPADECINQRCNFVLLFIKNLTSPAIAIFLNKILNGFPEPLKNDVFNHLLSFSKTNQTIGQTMIQTAEKIINNWKIIYSQQTGQQTSPSSLKMFLFDMEMFSYSIDSLTSSLIYEKLSNIPFPIQDLDGDEFNRKNRVIDIVNSNSTRIPFLSTNLERSIEDPYVSLCLETMPDLQHLFVFLEKSFLNEFEHHIEQFNFGKKLNVFLEVEKRLNPIITQSYLSNDTIQMLMTALFKGNDPIFFRMNLLNVIKIVKKMYNDIECENENENENFMNKIEYLHSIFNKDIINEKITNLQRWFSLNIKFSRF